MNRFLSSLAGILSCLSLHAQLSVQQLRTENRTNPVGLDTKEPRFSWQLAATGRQVLQTAYEIRVSSHPRELANGKASWSTGKVASAQSLHVPYTGALASGHRYFWQVRVWDNKGQASAWSAPASWQMALLQPSDWKARWIIPGFEEDSLRASPLFRKEFQKTKKIQSATAYITAHGLYEAQINGKRVGDAYFTPGFTSYHKRLQYQVYDVTNLLQDGANAIGLTLGDGWYRGNFGFGYNRNLFGKDIALLFQLDLTYADGSSESIVSDNSWKSSTGAIRMSAIYQGETIDARQEKGGWATAGYNDNGWSGAKEAAFAKDVLVATGNEPVKKQEILRPVRIFKTPRGEQVLDFGQNLAGWVVLKAAGKAGDTITVSHAEVLDKAGNFYTENLRKAAQRNTYILSGAGVETLEPHFTWQGFRYVKLEGYPGDIKPENVTAVALYSDMAPAGSFTSSNKLINQLQQNIEWGLKGNFLDIPTDCPQRDERQGWTGDAQVFYRTATFLRDVSNFFAKWMKDVAADQLPNGSVPNIIPNSSDKTGGAAGWGDVATIIPWNHYLVYGDRRMLEEQYPGMKAWVEYIRSQSPNDLWNSGKQFGDWLSYTVDNDLDGVSAITNKSLIAQCFYAHSTQLLVNAAKVLGKTEDAAQYTELLARVKDAFRKEYTTPNGATVSHTQTAYVLALQFDMLPEALRRQAADRLVENIRQYKNHLTTGFLGTPYLCHVLSRFGHADKAFTLLQQETYPSWLYPVKMGATTIWERWDGIRPNGTLQTPTMNSFNHYAYGAIGDWMYRVMVGLDTEEPGYKKIRIKPHIGGSFTHASATYQTPYGKLASGWKLEGGRLTLEAEIPPNTTATVYVPAAGAGDVQEGGKPVTASKDIRVTGTEGEYVVLNVGSGSYRFTAPAPVLSRTAP
ncbi:glycoside hydrolase family 78 protein [Paraflavisolibacter sp. H34]|uniref:glycoside hydrolase family 78 protein n=1 Tax=Huijunlia imazamoxiresistens TaxID=3127457 RepID=UPI003018AB61